MAYALPHEIREGKSFIVSPIIVRIIIPTGTELSIFCQEEVINRSNWGPAKSSGEKSEGNSAASGPRCPNRETKAAERCADGGR